MRTGFVTVIGRPNVGKSSIVNAIVGEKVAIVSPKPQTTRDKILGIYNTDEYQIVFVDTPGVHAPRTKLGDYMMKSVKSAVVDTDLILLVVSAEHGIERQDMELINKYASRNIPMVLAYNKMDLISHADALPELAKLNEPDKKDIFDAVVPVSCKNGFNLDSLIAAVKARMKEGEPFYPQDEYTDKPMRYIVAETVREKILLFLQQEIPHGVQVVVERMDMTDDSMFIDAMIVVEKATHKPIVIGKGGETIKRIGMAARKDLERTFGSRVVLKTFVKVVEDWRNKPSQLNDLGFDPKTLKN